MSMADSTSLDAILEFLRKNKFTRAEAALRGELNKCSDLNGVVQKLMLEDKELSRSLEEANGGKVTLEILGMTCRNGGKVFKETSSRSNGEIPKELIVKEIECGIGRNGTECNLKNVAYVGKKEEHNESVGTNNKTLSVCNNAEDSAIDMYSWNYNPNGSLVSYQNNGGTSATKDFSGLVHSGKLRLNSSEVFDNDKANENSGEDVSFSGERRTSPAKTMWNQSMKGVKIVNSKRVITRLN